MEAIRIVSWQFPASTSPRRIRRPATSRVVPMAAVAAMSELGGSRMFVFGTGFVGRYVSERLIQEGWEVSGTCTSAAKKKELEDMGVGAFVFDARNSKLTDLHALQHATHLLISIPTMAVIGDPLLFLYEDLESTLRQGNLQWLCYLSSTSVYGDCGGAWVDEDYPVNPKRASAKLRYTAEKGWLQLANQLGLSAYIFRLGGIYGPGRSALDTIIRRKSLSEGQTMRESRYYTARIHVADIYRAIKASMNAPLSRKVYNVVDDDPAPRAEVFAFAQTLIERKYPDMIRNLRVAALPDTRSTSENTSGEKRVSNARLKDELGVTLLYPTYRSGLHSIIGMWSPDSP
ncbi:uncharacterized protein [Typha latifolia]|uniref:uncharacterized protein n=1 Tax=Typha latifolia TaxID=4733 RepID=UPI003C2D0971